MSERAALCLVIDSSTTNPTVVINGPYQCGGADSADVIAIPILAHDRPHLEKELGITVPGK